MDVDEIIKFCVKNQDFAWTNNIYQCIDIMKITISMKLLKSFFPILFIYI